MDATITKVIDILTSAAASELALQLGLEKDVRKLRSDLLVIMPVIRDLEEEVSLGEGVQAWLRNLKDFAYDAEDVLDELKTDATLQPGLLLYEEEGAVLGLVKIVSGCFPSCFTSAQNPVKFRRQMGSTVKDLTEELSDILRRRQFLGLQSSTGTGKNLPGTSVARQTHHLADTIFPLVGREEPKQLLIKALCDVHESSPGGVDVHAADQSSTGGDGEHIHVVPIVGMGGVGKTTLAQAIFNDGQVKNKFPIMKWLFVGEVFDGVKLIREITDQYDERLSLEKLIHRLGETIGDKSVLLVLDDVWTDKRRDWEVLFTPLRQVGKGRKVVLVTTRNQAVAETMGPPSITVLPPLTYEQCLSIFERCAFGARNPGDYPELKQIGEQIVHKLGGNPLAAKTLGAALGRKLRKHDWEKILNSEIWLKKLSDSEGEVIPILRLSYHNLPSELKQCFVYCSIFPKDHSFNRETLIQMWMAQGYIVPEGGVRIEDTASDYFEELLDRSFFQHVGGHYVVHDLMHDLAESLSVEECMRIEEINTQKERSPQSIRHVSVCSRSVDPGGLHAYRKSRTLLCFRGLSLPPTAGAIPGVEAALLRQLFNRLKRIRVLDLSGSWIPQTFPKFIGDLKHVRFLDLTNTRIVELPESVCSLINLQTLRVYRDCILPNKSMYKLVNLRHLEAGKFQISTIPWLGKLTCLQELPAFRVNQVLEGHTMEELRGMTQLRGRLCIDYMKDVGTAEDAARARLKDKKLLRGLEFDWRRGSTREMTPQDEDDVMEVLKPHGGLEELRLLDFGGTKAPSWMAEELAVPKLVSVELTYCGKWEALPPLGQLRFLKSLKMGGMAMVAKVGTEFFFGHDGSNAAAAFPSLEELSFQYMERWASWNLDEEVGECRFPRLRLLELNDCPLLAFVSPSLRQRVEEALGANKGTLDCQGCPELLKTWPSIPPPEELTVRDRRLLLWALLKSDGKLQSLQVLKLQGCIDLTTFTDADVEAALWQQSLPCLRELHIHDCPNLSSFLVGHLPVLQLLRMHRCVQMQALPSGLQGLHSLQELHIEDCASIRSLQQLKCLPCLRELYIVGCPAVEKLPELKAGLKSLQKLHVIRCPLVQSLPVLQDLHSFQELHIAECPGLHTLPELQGLDSLRELYISECANIQLLPELQSLPSLQELYIIKCPRVQALPELHGLSSLRVLNVIKCPEVRALPESGLPSTMWTLVIRGCPLLIKRCRKTKGADWPKIAHVPHVQINWEAASGLRDG